MQTCGLRTCGWAFALSMGFCYILLELRHLYDIAVKAPPMQRVVRTLDEISLPRLYLCPAQKGTRAPLLRWHSYECLLHYHGEEQRSRSCPVKLGYYNSAEPQHFEGNSTNARGACMEFGTDLIRVKKDLAPDWNEIILRAAFEMRSEQLVNILQEVELGYMPTEWHIRGDTAVFDARYFPLLRVPTFFLYEHTGGMATRVFLAEEKEKGFSHVGKYFYTYGGMQIPVVDATLPSQGFIDNNVDQSARVNITPPQWSSQLSVVHVVVTLEDFHEFEFQVMSPVLPFLGVVGEIAGVLGLLAWLLKGPLNPSRGRQQGRKSGGAEPCGVVVETQEIPKRARRVVEDYISVAAQPEETQTLLGGHGEANPGTNSEGEDSVEADSGFARLSAGI